MLGRYCGGTADRLKAIPHFLVKSRRTKQIEYLESSGIKQQQYQFVGLLHPPCRGVGLDGWRVGCIIDYILSSAHTNRGSCLYNNPSQVDQGIGPIPSSRSNTQVVCVCARAFPEEELEYYRGTYPKVFHLMFQPLSQLLSFLESQLELMEPRLTLDKTTH